jgi:chromosome segregation ATPase
MLMTTPKLRKAVTPEMYETVLEELDTVTVQLKKTRESLWETQDTVKDAEDKAKSLELHIEELVQAHGEQDGEIKKLRAENSTHIEEEAKVRESLELMKKVFTRNQLKAREDQETMMLLQEERDLLLEENKHLRIAPAASKQYERGAIQRIKRESLEKERHLTSILHKIKAELNHTRSKYKVSDESVKTLQKKLATMNNPEETNRALELQRQKINILEYQIQQLHEQDDDVLNRGLTKEDVGDVSDDSPMQQFAQQLGCTFMGLSQS